MIKNHSIFIKYFEYDGKYAIKNLLIALKYIFLNNKNNLIIEKILEQKGITIGLPMFIKAIDEYLDTQTGKNLFIDKPLRVSNGKLPSSIAGLYYAMFFAFKLNKSATGYKGHKHQKISEIVLQYHYEYLIYQSKEKVKKQKENFYKDCVIAVTRCIEYLVEFSRQEDTELNEKYLNDSLYDLIDNFFEMATQDISESNYYYIKHDGIHGNFLVYDNNKIHVQVITSRKIKKGSSQSIAENKNISNYLKIGYESYKKIKNNIYKKVIDGGKGYTSKHTAPIQFTENEILLNDIEVVNQTTSTDMNIEEELEAFNKQKMKKRAFPTDEDNKNIPNVFKQRLRNIAFSSQLSKHRLLLATDYTIPDKVMYKEFIHFIAKKPLQKDFIKEDFFRVVFLLDALLGIGYVALLDLFLDTKKKVTFSDNVLKVAINKLIYAKERIYNDFLPKSKFDISYNIPYYLALLLNKYIQYFTHSVTADSKDTFLLEIDESLYYKYMNSLQKEYTKKMSINFREMWRVIASYKKKDTTEDMSTLLAMGRYQQNDTPRLAYSSTNARGQVHSMFIKQLYNELGYHILIENLLSLPVQPNKEFIEVNEPKYFVGSQKSVLIDKSIEFFRRLKSYIDNEQDSRKEFNLRAIYTRYALGILLGGRNFKNSINFKRVSFEQHIMVITEKSETLLSGARVIPLCSIAEELIQSYKSWCNYFSINHTSIVLLGEEDGIPFKRANAIDFMKEYKDSSYVIDFIESVPLNTGRHIVTKMSMGTIFNASYIETFLGHYIAGGEQAGIYSTLDLPNYIQTMRVFLENISNIYGIKKI